MAGTDDLNVYDAPYIRLETAPPNWSGIVAGRPGQRLTIYNICGSDVTMIHETGSASENQFNLPGATSFTISSDAAVEMIYDGVIQKWLLVGYYRR